MRTTDIVFEAGTDLDQIISVYWHLREGYERAIECDRPECHHASVDKKMLENNYNADMARICHQIVNLVMEVQ